MSDISDTQYEIQPEASEIAEPSSKPRGPGRPKQTRAPLHRAGRNTTRPNARVQARPQAAQAQEEEREDPRSKRLQRRRSRAEDALFIDPRIIPTGVSYEWKRVSVYGQPDPHHQNNLRENHWLPVPASRHPELVSENTKGTIAFNGMILMERPMYLTKEARQEDLDVAIAQVRSVGAQVTATPDNTMTRDHPSVKANAYIKRSYEPMSVPE